MHQVPGRLRVRVAAIHRNARAAAVIENGLRKAHGVRSVTANPLTGSVVVCYDSSLISSPSIVAVLSEHAARWPAHAKCAMHARPAIRPAAVKVAGTVAPWLAKKALEYALERSVMLLIAAVL